MSDLILENNQPPIWPPGLVAPPFSKSLPCGLQGEGEPHKQVRGLASIPVCAAQPPRHLPSAACTPTSKGPVGWQPRSPGQRPCLPPCPWLRLSARGCHTAECPSPPAASPSSQGLT